MTGVDRGAYRIMTSFIIVEDDFAVRYLLKEMVGGLGHTLIADVDNIASAITYLRAGKVPDIIFLDVVLPGESGVGLTEYLRVNHKEIKIVLTTGLSEERVLKTVPQGSYDAILLKPFTFGQMERVIKDLLVRAAVKQPPPVPGAPEKPADRP